MPDWLNSVPELDGDCYNRIHYASDTLIVTARNPMPDSPNAAPILDTERLILRPHTLADFDAYAEMWADPVMARFISGKPRTREESWLRFPRHAGMWSLLGFGFWAVEEKETGRLVGEAGFHEARREIEPSFEGVPETGWGFAPQVHGRGYATEAMEAVLAWGAGRFGPVRIVCIIDPGNTASLRVAAKCGFREVLRTTYHGEPTVLFDRTLDR